MRKDRHTEGWRFLVVIIIFLTLQFIFQLLDSFNCVIPLVVGVNAREVLAAPNLRKH